MNRRTGIGFGIIAGIVILAGAAYLGALLINRSKAAVNHRPEAIVLNRGDGVTSTIQEMRQDITPAPEIPRTRPIIRGAILEKQNNRVMVGTNPKVTAIGNPDGSIDMKYETDGPQSEVVLTGRTLMYRETTLDSTDLKEGEPIQQMVEEISLADIQANSGIVVWGQRQGDRIIADTVLYIGAAAPARH